MAVRGFFGGGWCELHICPPSSLPRPPPSLEDRRRLWLEVICAWLTPTPGAGGRPRPGHWAWDLGGEGLARGHKVSGW